MPTLTLSHDSRDVLSAQAAQNGTFIHGLHNAQGVIVAMAYILIEQCATSIQVRIELGDSCNSLTLPRDEATGDRLASTIEELANGASPDALTLMGAEWDGSALQVVIREALQQGEGEYPIPDNGQELDLTLILSPSPLDPRRLVFFFQMHGHMISLPLRLPLDRLAAFRLLTGSVPELIANYRSAA